MTQVLDATNTGNITLAAHYEYDPYGNVINDISSYSYATANPIRFSTKWFDAETHLGYWGYRYYSPRLGRWLSRDPIGEQGGIHLFGYVSNSPTIGVDPRGERGTGARAICKLEQPWGVTVELQPELDLLPCLKACVLAHEYVHVVQLTPCCLFAQWAYQKALTSAGVDPLRRVDTMVKIKDAFDAWSVENDDIDECEAYGVEFLVNAGAIVNPLCCGEIGALFANLDGIINGMKRHCPKAKPRSSCPDFLAILKAM